jgi:hypothetical protein
LGWGKKFTTPARIAILKSAIILLLNVVAVPLGQAKCCILSKAATKIHPDVTNPSLKAWGLKEGDSPSSSIETKPVSSH